MWRLNDPRRTVDSVKADVIKYVLSPFSNAWFIIITGYTSVSNYSSVFGLDFEIILIL